MTAKPTKRPVIAVFGGSDPSPEVEGCARKLGQTIARSGHILLTGGTGPASGGVKGAAIRGAVDEHSPWVGVERRPGREAEACPQRDIEGLVLYVDLGHKRNYLEAYLCDAAVGLEGKKGTPSEMASALSLQRPVAFVGGYWDQWDLEGDPAGALSSIATAANVRFETEPPSPLDGGIRLIPSRLKKLRAGDYKYFNAPATAEDVVTWITCAVLRKGQLGAFPPRVKAFSAVARDYRAWVKAQGPNTNQ